MALHLARLPPYLHPTASCLAPLILLLHPSLLLHSA